MLLQINSSSLFLDGRCSSIFDLGPLTPKIYSPKFGAESPSIFDLGPPNPQNLLPKIWHRIAYKSAYMADTPEMFGPTRGFSGMADSMEPCKMLCGQPLLTWQRHLR